MPEILTRRLRKAALPPSLAAYAARAEWPAGWAAREALPDRANFGLLLRWEAALAEMRAFAALPEKSIADFFEAFAGAVRVKMTAHPAFELLPAPAPDRQSLTKEKSWDRIQTIFPFLLRRPGGLPLDRDQTKAVYERLQKTALVGQPVLCGHRQGIAISALRLCLSARLAVDALTPQGRGTDAVIAEALSVLDTLALLAAAV